MSSVNTAGSRNDAPYAAVDERTTSRRMSGACWQAASSDIVPMTLCSFIAARPPDCWSTAVTIARCTTTSAPLSASSSAISGPRMSS